jgi:hypothetical protein
MIDKYFYDWDSMIKDSPHLYKNQLLEYLQDLYKLTPKLKFDYEKIGPDNDTRWIVRNPKILDQNQNTIIKLPKDLRSNEFRRIKDAEKDLSLKILNYLQEK